VSVRFRQLAPVGLVLGLTVAGFVLARAFGEMDARRDSTHRADIAATQVRDSVAQASTLADGVRRFLVGPASPTKEFTDVGGWLSLVGLPAAAWVEPVPSSQRVAYERGIGHQILEATPSGELAPAAPRTSYLPATLATGVPPMGAEGIDLGNAPGVAAAVGRPQTAYRVTATSLGRLLDGTRGLFLVQSAQRLSRGVVEPGYVVLFVPASWLLAAAANTDSSSPSSPELRITVGSTSAGNLTGSATNRSTFAAAGQRFAVEVARGKVHGAAEVLPWIILAGGLALATLAGALRVIATRRAKAKAEVDRLFTISQDLIVVAGFDGYFKRVNPAFQARLGYTEDEALARPYLEFVHPDDRERTTVEANRLGEGERTIAFENRYICKDGSYRWVEWTATPVLQERLIYAVARDVTERRQAESKVERLAEEQAALHRVATLVARGVPPDELFAAVTDEVGQLLPVGSSAMGRYDPDGKFTTVAAWTIGVTAFPVGKRWVPEGKNVMTIVFETGRPARIDNFADASGPVGVAAREAGYRSAVGTPITVEGRLWGVMTAASSAEEPLPSDTEVRLASFTELVATAIANAESRAGLARLAEEQAALRRVATLVAEGVPPAKVFSTLCDEVNRLLVAEATTIGRLEPDGRVTIVAITGSAADESALGSRLELKALPVTAAVVQTGRSARKDNYADAAKGVLLRDMGIHSGVGVPIVVEGALWGAIGIGTVRDRFPEDTEQRLEKFTQLAATAIADAESRAGLARLAEEQAALRRVATLVAEGVPPAEVFSALSDEVNRLLGAQTTAIERLEADGSVTVVAVAGSIGEQFSLGTRLKPQPGWVLTATLETARPARKENYGDATERIPGIVRDLGIRSSVGVPIMVEGAVWGVIIIGTVLERFPDNTERRLEAFTELVATAIMKAETRSELTASRARIVAAADETRRRIERDLHDGTQQRLVSLGLALRAAEANVPPELGEVRAELSRTASGLADAVEDLQEISRGIHPAILSRGGLAPALETLVGRAAVPVKLTTRIHRELPESVEVAAYYVVSEALTNAAKHAQASAVHVELRAEDSIVALAIRDDGVGGADPAHGSGLVGLRDRVEALGGTFEVASAPGVGTSLLATIPTDGLDTLP
jgi:PAS domain S-box-containing protein